MRKNYARVTCIQREFIIKSGQGKPTPTIEEIREFMRRYENEQQYRIDGGNCADFVLAVLTFIGGHPQTGIDGFGQAHFKYGNIDATITTPNALGNDIQSAMDNWYKQIGYYGAGFLPVVIYSNGQ